MKAFKITSKLTPAQAQRLRKASEQVKGKGFLSGLDFVHVDEDTYAGLDDVNVHEVARHAMVVAGTTFDYEVVEK
jgi:hypothetical protein